MTRCHRFRRTPFFLSSQLKSFPWHRFDAPRFAEHPVRRRRRRLSVIVFPSPLLFRPTEIRFQVSTIYNRDGRTVFFYFAVQSSFAYAANVAARHRGPAATCAFSRPLPTVFFRRLRVTAANLSGRCRRFLGEPEIPLTAAADVRRIDR